jgi:hypothetical protein
VFGRVQQPTDDLADLMAPVPGELLCFASGGLVEAGGWRGIEEPTGTDIAGAPLRQRQPDAFGKELDVGLAQAEW